MGEPTLFLVQYIIIGHDAEVNIGYLDSTRRRLYNNRLELEDIDAYKIVAILKVLSQSDLDDEEETNGVFVVTNLGWHVLTERRGIPGIKFESDRGVGFQTLYISGLFIPRSLDVDNTNPRLSTTFDIETQPANENYVNLSIVIFDEDSVALLADGRLYDLSGLYIGNYTFTPGDTYIQYNYDWDGFELIRTTPGNYYLVSGEQFMNRPDDMNELITSITMLPNIIKEVILPGVNYHRLPGVNYHRLPSDTDDPVEIREPVNMTLNDYYMTVPDDELPALIGSEILAAPNATITGPITNVVIGSYNPTDAFANTGNVVIGSYNPRNTIHRVVPEPSEDNTLGILLLVNTAYYAHLYGLPYKLPDSIIYKNSNIPIVPFSQLKGYTIANYEYDPLLQPLVGLPNGPNRMITIFTSEGETLLVKVYPKDGKIFEPV